MLIEPLPLVLKTNDKLNIHVFSDTTNVCVRYCLYERKKKRIIKLSENRANGYGSSKITNHAEECAIKDLQKMDPKNKCDIYIWRYSKMGEIKPATCCKSCTKLLRKYNYDKRVFTFDNGEIKNAIVDNPVESIGNIIRKLR